MNKKTIILLIVVIAVIGAIYYLEKDKAKPLETFRLDDNSGVEEFVSEDKPLMKDGKYPLSPELAGIDGYINTNGDEIKISDFEGKVVLIDFWTYTCINCIRTLPYLTAWDEKYRDDGLVIIGVHTPEFEFEKERENVVNAMDKYGIEYRVVQDNDYATWRAFENRFWPRKYLIDSEGYVRYDHIGEGAYEETEKKIQELLAEIGKDVSDTETEKEGLEERFPTTPELYAGALQGLSRGQYIGNQESEEVIADYILPESINKNIIYLDGRWERTADDSRLLDDSGGVVLEFTAKEVNIVANYLDSGITEMDVLIDGNFVSKEQAGIDVRFDGSRAYIMVDKPQLYNVFDGDYGNYRLDLKVQEGFSFNAFTFG